MSTNIYDIISDPFLDDPSKWLVISSFGSPTFSLSGGELQILGSGTDEVRLSFLPPVTFLTNSPQTYIWTLKTGSWESVNNSNAIYMYLPGGEWGAGIQMVGVPYAKPTIQPNTTYYGTFTIDPWTPPIVGAGNGPILVIQTYSGTGQYFEILEFNVQSSNCTVTGLTESGCTNLDFVSGSTTNPTCTNDGEITITISGGNPDYVYNLNGGTYSFTGSATTHTFTGLSQGSYVGSISDSLGNNTIILNPFVLTNSFYVDFYTASTSTTGSTYCYIVTGLTESYVNVSIDSGTIFTASTNTTNCFDIPISSNTTNHSILISQPISGSPCTYSTNFQSQNPYSIDIDVTITGGCGYSTANVNLTGGSPSYTYYAQNGNDIRTNVSSLSSATFNNLTSGNWSFWAIDSNGISSQTQTTLSILNPFNANVTRINDLNICFEITGGTAPYDIYIDGLIRASGATGTTHCFTADCATNHTYSVVDSTPPCIFTVNDPIFLNQNFTDGSEWITSIDNLGCANFSANTVIGGGLLTYTSTTSTTSSPGCIQGLNAFQDYIFPYGTPISVSYNWSLTSATINNYTYITPTIITPFGNQSLPINNFGWIQNNVYSGSFTIPSTTFPVVYSGYGINFSSSMSYNSTIGTIQLSGLQLTITSYTVDCRCTISGITNSGCTPPVLVLDASGGGACDSGYANVSITGGRPSYTYTASGDTVIVNSTGIFTNLTSGVWTIQAEDSLNQLTNIVTFTITNQFYTNMTTIGNDILCITVTGGTPPYDINIDGIFMLSATTGGTYCFSGYSATCDTLHTYSITDSTPPCTYLVNEPIFLNSNFVNNSNWISTTINGGCANFSSSTVIGGGFLTYTSTTSTGLGSGGCFQNLFLTQNYIFPYGTPLSVTYNWSLSSATMSGYTYIAPRILTPFGNFNLYNTPINAFGWINNSVYSGSVTIPSTTFPIVYSGYGIEFVNSMSYNNSIGQLQLRGYQLTIASYSIDCSCTSSGSTYLPCLTPPILYVDSYSATCAENSGYVMVHAEYGTPPYQYSAICSGVTYEVNSTGIFTGLTFCNWEFIASDASGFTSQSEFVNIIQNNFTIDVTSPNGQTICVNISGGTPPYTIFIDEINVLSGTSGTSHCFSATCGNHNVVVKDSTVQPGYELFCLSFTDVSGSTNPFNQGGCIVGEVYYHETFLLWPNRPLGSPIAQFNPNYVDGLEPYSALTQPPISYITLSNFNVPSQSCNIGFPGEPTLIEYYQIEFFGLINVPTTDTYVFRLGADDGALFSLPSVPYTLDNDFGAQPYHVTVGSPVNLNSGVDYPFTMSYWQGPPNFIGLVLEWSSSTTSGFEIVPTSAFVCSGNTIDNGCGCTASTSINLSCEPIIIYTAYTASTCFDDGVIEVGISGGIPNYVYYAVNLTTGASVISAPTSATTYTFTGLDQGTWNVNITDSLGNISVTIPITFVDSVGFNFYTASTSTTGSTFCYSVTGSNLTLLEGYYFAEYSASTTNDPLYFTALTNTINCFDVPISGCGSHIFAVEEYNTYINTYVIPPPYDCTNGMDVVFLVDYTSSMGGIINGVKSGITQIVNTISNVSNNNYRIGLVVYDENCNRPISSLTPYNTPYYTSLSVLQKNRYNNLSIYKNPPCGSVTGISQFITAIQPFTTNSATFTTSLNNLNTPTFPIGTGLGLPDPGDIGLRDILFPQLFGTSATNNTFVGNFRNNVAKIIIFITDTVVSGDDDTYNDIIATLENECIAQGIRVILMRNCPSCAGDVLETLATNTSGFTVDNYSPISIQSAIETFCTGLTVTEVIELSGCSFTQPYFVPCGDLSLVADSVDPYCEDYCFGEVTLSVTGGTPPYTYQLTDINGNVQYNTFNLPLTATTSSNTYMFDNICPSGTSSVTLYPIVTDSFGLTANTSPVTLSYTFFISISVSNVITTGLTGTVCIDVSGDTLTGYPIYIYSGNGVLVTGTTGNLGQNCFELPAGECYEITVQDPIGIQCSDTENVCIPFGSFSCDEHSSYTNPSCDQNAFGTISVSVSGGVSPYNYYLYYNGGITPLYSELNSILGLYTFQNLSAGTYTAVVVDSNGISATCYSNIVLVNDFYVDIVQTTSCLEYTEYCVTISGGSPPYTIYDQEINIPVSAAGTTCINILCGNATIYVFDSQDTPCLYIESFTGSCPVTITATTTNGSCNGSQLGSITINGSGGLLPYQYSIDGITFVSNNVFTGLTVGNYTAYIIDSNGCLSTLPVTITSTNPIVFDVITTGLNCDFNNIATITINASGGTPPYQYSIDGGLTLSSSNFFTGLTAGSYDIFVRDIEGCITEETITIDGPLSISSTTTDVSCNFGSGGTITVSVGSGNPPYQYSIDGGPFGVSNVFTGITAGAHFITVVDVSGCSATTTTQVSGIFTITPAIQYPDCNSGATGVINTFVTGGLPPYQYSIDGITYTSSGYFSGLTSGIYTIYVLDSNNCSGSTEVDLTVDELIIAVAGTVVNDCIKKGEGFGGPNGTITITVIYPGGGVGPYIYSINSGSTFSSNNVFTGLTAGTYTVVACDTVLSCCTTDQIILPTVPHVDISATTTPVDCFSPTSGTIDITISGGTPNYNYFVYRKLSPSFYTLTRNGSTSSTNVNLTGFTSGTYLINVYDSNGCLDSVTVDVDPPILVSGTSTSVTCSNISGGTITINASSGTPPYQYALSGESFTTNNYFTGLTAGNYTFLIIDSSGCTATTTSTVSGAISLSAITTDVTCLNSTAGTISVSVITGGTAPYTFSFNGGSFGSTTYFSGLTDGNYTISVLDSSGCSATTIVTINPPYTISIDAFSTPETCTSGGTITALGTLGNDPYTYSIDGSPYSVINYFTDLSAGTYTIDVIDASGCSATTNVTVDYIQPFEISATTSVAPCVGGVGGTITIYDLGGTPPYEYSLDGVTWFFFPFFGNITIGLDILGILVGDYTLYIRDANGCIASTDITISAQSYINVSAVTTPENCNYTSGGTVTVYGSGGTAPYTYSIDGVTFTSNNYFTGLTVGTYTITVRDVDGCEGTLDIIIDPPIVISGSSTPETCLYNSGGTITVTGTTGTPPYQYSVDGGAFTNNNFFTGLTVGDHTIVVVDVSGCSATTVVTIDPPILISATTTPEDCLLSSAATATLFASMGVSPYQYALSGQSFTSNNYFTGLTVGTYTFIAQDSSGCSATTVVTIDPPVPVTVSATSTDESCFLNSGGTITITADGGNPPYQYSIDSGNTFSSSNYFNGYPSGTYDIVVLDSYGCSGTTTVSIGSPLPMSASSTVFTATSCYNPSIVEVTLLPSGGTPPYTFYWPDLSANTQTVTINDYLNIPGSYSILGYVFDRFGCSAFTIADFVIEPPLDPTLLIYSSGTLTCDGSDYVTLSAVTIPQYDSITWSDSSTGVSFITANTPGSYYYYVDISGCTYTSDTVILDYIIIPPVIGNDVTICVCNSTEISLLDNGYTYTNIVWSNGDSGTTATTVSSCTLGDYTYYLTAVDDKGCSVTSNTVTVTYVQLEASLFTTNPSCDGCTDGYAEVQLDSGGIAPFTFYWTGTTSTTSFATGLTNGVIYTVKVEDSTGCYAIFTFQLEVDPCATPLPREVGGLDPICECTYLPYTAFGEIILNPDGTISFYNPTLPAGNQVQSVPEVCCVTYSTEELPLYHCEGACYWTLSGCTTDSSVIDKIILGVNGSEGVQLINTDTTNCNYQVSFDYLFNFDCKTLFDCIDEETIYSGSVLSFLSGLSAYATVEVLTGNTYVTRQIVPIWRFNFNNQPTGVYFGGEDIYCDIINELIYDELGLNCTALTENTFATIWQKTSFKIFDSLSGQTIKIGLMLEGFNCKYNILLDNLKIEEVCVFKNEEILSDNDCPGFDLVKIVDNKKSWVYNESLYNRDWYHLKYRDTSYDDYHERLDINTKEVDLEIDVASAIEYDAYCYALSEPCYFSNECNNPELFINQGRFINNSFIRPGGLKKSLLTSGLTIGEQYIIQFGIQKNGPIPTVTVSMEIGFETPGTTSEQLYLEGINLTAGGIINNTEYFSYTATIPTYTGVLTPSGITLTEYTNFYIKISSWVGNHQFSIINSTFSSVSIVRVCDQAILNPSEFVTITPELTFSEFKELLQTQMIDVKNRQPISDYPLLRYMFEKYLGLCNLNDCNTQSNQYNYSTLNGFVGLLGDYWMDLMEQFVPATTIWKAGTRTYRNTVFDQPKFEYRNFSLGYCDETYCQDGDTVPTPPVYIIYTSATGYSTVEVCYLSTFSDNDPNTPLLGLTPSGFSALSNSINTTFNYLSYLSTCSAPCDCFLLPITCFVSASTYIEYSEGSVTGQSNTFAITNPNVQPTQNDMLSLIYNSLTNLGYNNLNPYNNLEWSRELTGNTNCSDPIIMRKMHSVTYSCVTVVPAVITGFTYEKIHDFRIGSPGSLNQILIYNDNLIGMSQASASYLGSQIPSPDGYVYSFDTTTNNISEIRNFTDSTLSYGANDGLVNPSSGLVFCPVDNSIYGTTQLYSFDPSPPPIYNNANYNYGALFKMDINNPSNYTVVHEFNISDGGKLNSSGNQHIFFSSYDNCFYIPLDSPNPSVPNLRIGAIYKWDPTNSIGTTIYNWQDWMGNVYLSDGDLVYSNYIFGVSQKGGSTGQGTLFIFDRTTPNNTYQVLYEFDPNNTTYNGMVQPTGPLAIHTNGLFYGLTANYLNKPSVIFQTSIFGTASVDFGVAHIFNAATEGTSPTGKLLLVNDLFYGVCTKGGQFGYGTIFQFEPISRQLTVIHHFSGATYDDGSLIQYSAMYLEYNANDDYIYGTTQYGGTNNYGIIYRFKPVGSPSISSTTINTCEAVPSELYFELQKQIAIITTSAVTSGSTSITGATSPFTACTPYCSGVINNNGVEIIVEDLTNIVNSPCVDPPIVAQCNYLYSTHIDNDVWFNGTVTITNKNNTNNDDGSVITNDENQL